MKLLFVCTGNTCRSPMAQAIFTDMAKECGIDFVTGSAGLHAQDGTPASEYAVLACGETGLDISGHSSKSIRDEDFFLRRFVCRYDNGTRPGADGHGRTKKQDLYSECQRPVRR